MEEQLIKEFKSKGSLDSIDAIDFKQTGMSQDKLLHFAIIIDAITCYLYFGTSHKNTSSIHDFWAAYNYLFHVRSYEENTWKNSKEIDYMYKGSGKHIRSSIQLTDEELKNMCFDIHYIKSDFHKVLPINKFLEWLEIKRKNLVTENYDSIMKFIVKVSTKINCKPCMDKSKNMKYLVNPGPNEISFMKMFNV